VGHGDGEVVVQVGLEDRGQSRVLEHDVPVAVAVACFLGVAGAGSGVDVGLVGVVPVPAGQPDGRVVPYGDLDVVGGRIDPRCRLFVQPCEGEI
jgi:hypothetical protein